MRRKDSKDLLKRVRDRFKIMVEADSENRRNAIEDIRFVNVPGAQWDENMKKLRGKDRPCYEFNKTRVRCKRIVNDIRGNRPSGKVRPVEGGDKKIAEIYEGLIRNIFNVSHADNATDYAAEYQVEGGMGAWRINTRYADDSSFNQDIAIEGLENPFCLYCDPTARDVMKRDAEDWILTERISHKLFETRYGKAAKADFEGDGEFADEDADEWVDDNTVRVAEYWYKKPHKKELWLMDGPQGTMVVDSETDEGRAIAADRQLKAQIKDIRVVKTHKICMVVASGDKILEGPNEWAGRYFPFVMVYGETKVIEGKRYWWGLPRFARDPQQELNVARTAIAEAIAGAPKEYFWATETQAEGHVEQWATAHYENLPWKIYKADPKVPGPPTRVGGADVPVALMNEAQIADRDLDDCMGIPDASLGEKGDEKSGRAIYARQQQGEIATFNYKDNMAKAIEWTYEILIDLIPNIYDTERELRILGSDGKEDYMRVNQVVTGPDGKPVRVNDLSMGKYDVTITVGPSFSTLRQEAAETYGEMVQRFPELMGFAGDLVMKSMDLPYAEEISDRIRAMLPPQIQQTFNQDKDLPEEVVMAIQRIEQLMGQVQQYGQMVEAAAQELDQKMSMNDKEKAELRAEMAQIDKAKAEFDAHVARELQKLTMEHSKVREASAGLMEQFSNLSVKDADVRVREAMVQDKDAAMAAIQSVDETMANFMQAVDQAMQSLNEKAESLQSRTSRKITGGTTRREGGKLVAEVAYSDGSKRKLEAVRKKGNLELVPEPEDA